MTTDGQTCSADVMMGTPTIIRAHLKKCAENTAYEKAAKLLESLKFGDQFFDHDMDSCAAKIRGLKT